MGHIDIHFTIEYGFAYDTLSHLLGKMITFFNLFFAFIDIIYKCQEFRINPLAKGRIVHDFPFDQVGRNHISLRFERE